MAPSVRHSIAIHGSAEGIFDLLLAPRGIGRMTCAME
jgi:hypothetical protein